MRNEWLEQQRDAANRQAGKDDFWKSMFGSACEVAVAATTTERDKERNAKGTRIGTKRRKGTKRRSPPLHDMGNDDISKLFGLRVLVSSCLPYFFPCKINKICKETNEKYKK